MSISIKRISNNSWDLAAALGIRKTPVSQRIKNAVSSKASDAIHLVKNIPVKRSATSVLKSLGKAKVIKNIRLKHVNPFYLKGE